MANSIVRSRGAVVPMTSPQQQSGWVWDGSNWVCDPSCDDGSVPAPCPPLGPPVFSGPTAQPPWYPGANGGVSFGASPPPNPVRGHMFWDGVTFWLFDGAAWVGIGPGTPGTPGTPGLPPPSGSPSVGLTRKVFEIGTNSTSTVGAVNTPEIALINGSPTVNTTGTWDVNNHTYKPNRAGVYNFEVINFLQDPTYTAIFLILNDTGAPLNVGGSQFLGIGEVTSALTTWVNASGMAVMNGTTDFVRVWWQASTTTTVWAATGIPNIRAFLLP